MSVPPQFATYFEQQEVPPPAGVPFARTWLREQPIEQPILQAHAVPFRLTQWLETNWQQAPPDYLLRGYQHALPGMLADIDNQHQLLEYSTSPVQSVELQYIHRECANAGARQDLALNELEQSYVFEDRSAVAAFIERNRNRQLLLDARDPLNAVFGEAAVKKLTLVEDDEGFTKLFCLVLFSGDMREARMALRSFDEHWWLTRSGQSGGNLNFDFELI